MNINSTIKYAVMCLVLLFGLALLPTTTWAQKSAPVTVKNTADEPVPVANTPNRPLSVRSTDNPAWQPLQRNSFWALPNFPGISVPAGKRFVIEFVSMAATYNACRPSTFKITTTAGSQEASFNIPLSDSISGVLSGTTHTTYVVSQQVRLYADPETEVRASPAFVPGVPFCTPVSGIIGISGYLVDVP